MKKDFWENHDRSLSQSRSNALKSVNEMDLPKVVEISDAFFSPLGPRTVKIASEQLVKLREVHGDTLPYVIYV